MSRSKKSKGARRRIRGEKALENRKITQPNWHGLPEDQIARILAIEFRR